MLSEVALNLVRNEAQQLIAIKDGVEKECTAIAKATCHVIHVQVSLNVASHEVRRVNLISRVDRLVAETKVRACETTRLLRVVREVSLAILIGVVTDNLHRVLVGTDCTI